MCLKRLRQYLQNRKVYVICPWCNRKFLSHTCTLCEGRGTNRLAAIDKATLIALVEDDLCPICKGVGREPKDHWCFKGYGGWYEALREQELRSGIKT